MALAPEIAGLQMSALGFTLVYRPGGVPENGPVADDDGITPLIPVGLFINTPGNQSGTWIIETGGGRRITAVWSDDDHDWQTSEA